jgi:bifunctional non-homologous end joining protein LigD
MPLEKYKQKRSFKKTPEPQGGKSKDDDLRFVIQKHDASHLHYDFRLEIRGVLKSWAIPKGPSIDPAVKRLAMMVEDHPYNYKDFEGVIPKGNYGAGSVIIWDEGTYTSAELADTDKKKQEKDLLHQLYSGKVKFKLNGQKLKGLFTLVKVPARGENAWLLMKIKDEYVDKTDITKKDKSVVSQKTIEQIAENPSHVWHSNRSGNADESITDTVPSEEKGQPTQNDKALVKKISTKGKRAVMPKQIKPMLATLTKKPFDRDDWLYEIKWDGYRAIGYINKGKVDLLSRGQLSYNEKFSPIHEALSSWNTKAIVDGEIVALNEKGAPDFQLLQSYVKQGKEAPLAYYVFDLLWYEGKDLRELPLVERKELLEHVFPSDKPSIAYSGHVFSQGTAFFKAAVEQGLEGIMAKATDSIYATGRRSDRWLKIKNNKQTEAIICGYTEGRSSRKNFGAVILGKYEGKELIYIGHTGGGFNDKSLKELFTKFQPLITAKCPFKKKPKTNMPATWLEPVLVCEIKYTEVTDEGSLRHPIFIGLREDKKASDEKGEKIVAPPSSTVNKKEPLKTSKKTITEHMKTPTNIENFLPEGKKQVEMTIEGHKLKFTNLNKVYWPDEGITKGNMLNYYAAISPYILPYLKDRPQSLNRNPDGINAKGFYQKDVEGKVADWIETFPYESESNDDTIDFLVCKDKATLLYMANLGCIELNPWHSRITKPDNPDYCLIDLDPDKNPFEEVIETALVVKEVLDEIGAPSFVKTSGSTGIHILIPLGANYSFEQSRLLAELVVNLVQQRLPEITSTIRTPAKRKGKIYLDYLQNRQIQTMAVAYSLRPKPGATVSAPLAWEEVKKGLKITDFTIHNMVDRVAEKGDLLKGLLSSKGVDLKKVLSKLEDIA